jgi:hypothetical protein
MIEQQHLFADFSFSHFDAIWEAGLFINDIAYNAAAR